MFGVPKNTALCPAMVNLQGALYVIYYKKNEMNIGVCFNNTETECDWPLHFLVAPCNPQPHSTFSCKILETCPVPLPKPPLKT